MDQPSDRSGSPAWRGLALVLVAALAVGAAVIAIKRQQGRQPLKSFAMTDLDGKTWRPEDHRGKVLLINIWATWCPPCRAETPDLVEVANKYAPKGLDAVGISVDRAGAEASVKAFVESYRIPYPMVLATTGQLPVETETIPVTLLVDRRGKVAQRFDGAVDPRELSAAVERLLGEVE
jgi:thiol-disulfide isomerase/thioredoxin